MINGHCRQVKWRNCIKRGWRNAMKTKEPHATKICGAKTRNGGKCKNKPMGNGRCRMHGGKTPKGVDSPHFKTGRYSKYMPSGLLEIHEEMTNDPQLMSLRENIALTDTLLANLLPRLDTGESGKAWEMVKKLIKTAKHAYHAENLANMMQAFDDMEDLANQRILHYETEKEVRQTLDTRRKLVEAENRITLQQENAISIEQLMLFVSQVLGVIQVVVTEEKQRHAIAIELQKLISIPSGHQPPD